MFSLLVCLHTLGMQYPDRPAKVDRSCDISFTDDYELRCSTLEEKPVLLTDDSSFQPNKWIFFFFLKKNLLLIFGILSWETGILFKKPFLLFVFWILFSLFCSDTSRVTCSVLPMIDLELICIDKELISFFCRRICHFLQNHLLKSLPLFNYIFYTFAKNWRSSLMGLYLEPVFAAYVFILAVVPVPHYHIMLLLSFPVTIDLQYNLHSGMALLQHGTISLLLLF